LLRRVNIRASSQDSGSLHHATIGWTPRWRNGVFFPQGISVKPNVFRTVSAAGRSPLIPLHFQMGADTMRSSAGQTQESAPR
jgi:hypothetical protein